MFLDCDCNIFGSEEKSCDDNGKCTCKKNVDGPKCKECKKDYYGFPECKGILKWFHHDPSLHSFFGNLK